MNEKHERKEKENKKRRKAMIVLLTLLLIGCCVGGWALLGDKLTGRTPHEPARPAAPVTQLAEPTSPEDPTEPGQNTEPTEPTDPTEPGTDEPTDPTEPTEPVEPNDPVTTEPTTPDEPTEPVEPTPAPEPVHTHSYTDTRTEPTCTAEGKIVSKCSCGDTKTTVIPALGHDHSIPVYEEQTYETVVGYEEHRMCAACGMDLTAAGITGDALDAHVEQHILAGESSRTYSEWVDVTETVTEQVLIGHKCTRCGDFKLQ